MGSIEQRWLKSPGRRRALLGFAGLLVGSPLVSAQRDPRPLGDHRRVPGFDEMMTAYDFEGMFVKNLPQWVVDYTDHGAESEWTMRRNREAFDWVDVVARPGVEVAPGGTTTEILGHRMDFPILVAPTANQGPLHPTGESGMYQGATGAQTTMILSQFSTQRLERVAEAAAGPRWFQYTPSANAVSRGEILARAQGAGYEVLVVTVDTRSLYYERDLHSRHLGGTPRQSARPVRGPATWNPYGVSDVMPGVDWSHIDEIRRVFRGPVVLKGIVTVEDALLAMEHGVDGLVVSNHGGRGCDYAPSTLEVLPEVVDAVGGRAPVLIDGGFRHGVDILKALALGAQGVLLGRATRWALGAFGPEGVQRLLEILQTQLVEAMRSAGRPTLASLDRSTVATRFP